MVTHFPMPVTHQRWKKNLQMRFSFNTTCILLFGFITLKEHVNKNIH